MVDKKDFDPKAEKLDINTLLGEVPTEIEKIKAAQTASAVIKLALADQKVLAIHITFDVKGKFEIFQFGAAPEISKRAAYLANRIADVLHGFVAEYDIPHVDIQEKPAKS
jgi:hypothetical protein